MPAAMLVLPRAPVIVPDTERIDVAVVAVDVPAARATKSAPEVVVAVRAADPWIVFEPLPKAIWVEVIEPPIEPLPAPNGPTVVPEI
jgi:hypothetical protein